MEHEEIEPVYFSSDSYASSDNEQPESPRKAPKRVVESRAPEKRPLDEATRLEKRRRVLEKDIKFMRDERASLTRLIESTTTKLESVRKGTVHAKAKRPAGDEEKSKKEGSDTPSTTESDQFGRTIAKKPKLQETTEGEKEVAGQKTEGKGHGKVAMQNPLMQRLLLGTLQRSVKELARDTTDKMHVAKAEKERQTEEKLNQDLDAQRQAQIHELESKLRQFRQKLDSVSDSLSQKQEVLEAILWDEHEADLHGAWLVTKTEPHLRYRYARFDEKVQQEVEKQQKEGETKTTSLDPHPPAPASSSD